MPTPSELELGGKLALILAHTYLESSPTVSALAGVLAAVTEYNRETGKGPDHVPSAEELQGFIDGRKSRRIDIPEDAGGSASTDPGPSVGGSG